MKKILTGVASLALVFLLGACGGGNNEKASKDSGTQDKAVAAIKDAGVLKVGLSADFAPFEFHTMSDGKDKIVGADIDLANAIAEKLDVDVEFMDMEFNAVLSSLQQGKVDIAISGISATPERKESFDFSDNYYNPPQKIVINKKNAATFTSIESLSGKKIGAQKGSVQEDVAKTQIADAQIVSVAKVPNLIIELNQGSIDALVVEETVGASYIDQNPDLQFAEVDLKSSEDEAYAIALPKDSGELKSEINDVIKELNDSGKMEEFVQKNIELANKNAEK
ncbi:MULTISPECIES: transporter substrate-binding domain-containing protein [Enterococcus]|uniref:transporter substrate-binding domain-containing protein n=1 Tax=Enterococcus TaxID=1350 RepID=UPI0010F5E24A|nr:MULTISPECIES: transporter substrate-binding domain-containing protein [Enterococcus]KAF1303885.1 amino acid ABC transporter substrate-binding protein [Enterococcus sp. JM9B]